MATNFETKFTIPRSV